MENAATRNDAIADFNTKPKVLDSNDVEYRSREIGHEIRERGALVRSSERLNIAGVRSMEIVRRVAIKRTKQAYVRNLWRYVNIATKRRNPRTPEKRVAVINREAIIAGSTISNELIRLLVRPFSVVLRFVVLNYASQGDESNAYRRHASIDEISIRFRDQRRRPGRRNNVVPRVERDSRWSASFSAKEGETRGICEKASLFDQRVSNGKQSDEDAT